MNAPNKWYQETDNRELGYEISSRIDSDNTSEYRSQRKPLNRTKNRPASCNGIHRRRNKRWSW